MNTATADPASTTVPYNHQAQEISGPSPSTVAEPSPPPGGLGYSFFASPANKDSSRGTVSIPFQMAVDSGATYHYLDNELLPKIEHDMLDYVRLSPPMRILTAGGHLLSGTGKGVLLSIVTDQQGMQHSVRLPAIILPGLGKHLFSPVYALRTRGVGTTFARSSFVDLGKFRVPLRPDNNSMLHYIDLKIIRDEKPVGARTGSALVAEVVSGERMGVGTALSAGVSPSDIKTSGADKVRDIFPRGFGSNKVKPSCSSPDKMKKTPSCSKYGSSSTGSSGGRGRKIHENSRFKFNRRGNYRSRGKRFEVTSPLTSDRPPTTAPRQKIHNHHHHRHGHHYYQHPHKPLLYESRWHQQLQQQRQQQPASSDEDNCSSTNITLSAREKERYIREVLGIKKTNFPVATLLSHPRCGPIQLQRKSGSRGNPVEQPLPAQPNQTRITCYFETPAATSTSPARPSSSSSIDSLRAPRAPQHLRTRGYRDIT